MSNVLCVVGSLRQKSHTRRAMRIAADAAAAHGATVKTLDLAETQLPMLNPDNRDVAVAGEVRELVSWADAFILGSPDYHGSVSSALVNFLDYYWHEFTGKVFGYIVASHEKGLTVQDQMRTAIRQCYGWSMPYGVGFNGDAEMDSDGKVTNEQLEQRLVMLGRDVAVYGDIIHGQFKQDLAKEPRDPGFAQNFKG